MRLGAPLPQIQFHHAEFRTLAQATEDEAKVLAALRFVVGEESEVRREVQEGHHKNPIVVLAARMERTADVRRFVQRLAEDDAVRTRLAAQLDSRMDDHGTFYLRVAKADALLGRLVPSFEAGEDAIQIRLKVATYPARGDVARAKMAEYLESLATRKPK